MDIPDYEWHPPPAILVPHADHGDPECPGLLLPEVRGDTAFLRCNDCGAVVRTVPAAEADQAMAEMAATDTVCNEICPHCGIINVFVGWSSMMAYTCGDYYSGRGRTF